MAKYFFNEKDYHDSTITFIVNGAVYTPLYGTYDREIHFTADRWALNDCPPDIPEALRHLGRAHKTLAERLAAWTRIGGTAVAVPGRWRFNGGELHFTATPPESAEAVLLATRSGVRWYSGLHNLVAFAAGGLNGIILPLVHLGAPDGPYAGLSTDRIRLLIEQAAS